MTPNLSLWHLFMQADWIVKSVIIILILASVWCWAIAVEKYQKFKRLNEETNVFEEAFWGSQSLDDFHRQLDTNYHHPMQNLFLVAIHEWQNRQRGQKTSVSMRVERVMTNTLQKEMLSLEKGLGILATVGSTATFIGLFGTVWGIMNSFQAIAASKNTSLAIVAPGIAEALFATAIGLIAAIPAVMLYNKISADCNRYAGRLDNFTNEMIGIIDRSCESDNSDI
jgi:biopolymer transport protein TolQ